MKTLLMMANLFAMSGMHDAMGGISCPYKKRKSGLTKKQKAKRKGNKKQRRRG